MLSYIFRSFCRGLSTQGQTNTQTKRTPTAENKVTSSKHHSQTVPITDNQRKVEIQTKGGVREDQDHSPVLHAVEGFLVGDIVHEDEAHGPSVVGGGDGAVPLLAGRVLWGNGRG